MSDADKRVLRIPLSSSITGALPSNSLDRILSVATTPSQRRQGSDADKRVLRIPLSSSITGALPSDSFVLYVGYSLGECYSSAEMQ